MIPIAMEKWPSMTCSGLWGICQDPSCSSNRERSLYSFAAFCWCCSVFLFFFPCSTLQFIAWFVWQKLGFTSNYEVAFTLVFMHLEYRKCFTTNYKFLFIWLFKIVLGSVDWVINFSGLVLHSYKQKNLLNVQINKFIMYDRL